MQLPPGFSPEPRLFDERVALRRASADRRSFAQEKLLGKFAMFVTIDGQRRSSQSVVEEPESWVPSSLRNAAFNRATRGGAMCA
jgi:hypothetical protein